MTPLQDSLQPPIARQLFLEKDDSLIELSSDDDDPLHPTIQAMRDIFFLSQTDLDTLRMERWPT